MVSKMRDKIREYIKLFLNIAVVTPPRTKEVPGMDGKTHIFDSSIW
jgi:hypothetical protein